MNPEDRGNLWLQLPAATYRAFFCTIFLLAGSVASIPPVIAQTFPNKSVRIVTGEASGGVDTTLRIMTPHLAKTLGHSVIVENKGGASGVISVQTVMSATPDGHTLLYIGIPFWLLPLMETVPYDPFTSFVPISLTASAPTMLVVPASLGVKSVKELIALAMARPGELNYGSSSTGSSTHLAMELFNSMAGIKLQRINYKGSAAAVLDVLAGRTQAMFTTVATASPHIRSGRLVGLGVSTAQPSPLAPGVPTIASTVPGYKMGATTGLFAPAKTPANAIRRMNEAVAEVLNRADVKESFVKVGAEAVGTTPEELTATMKAETEILGKVIRDIGLGVQK